MRSTTFTEPALRGRRAEWTHCLAMLASVVLAALPAAAAGPEPGCWVRNYSPSHLARNPAQIVASITLKVQQVPGLRDRHATLAATFADQGRVAGGPYAGQMLVQQLTCWQDGPLKGCSVECDGGSFVVTRENAASLTIETDYLMIGDTEGCGGVEDLAESTGRPVKYRLDRADASLCGRL